MSYRVLLLTVLAFAGSQGLLSAQEDLSVLPADAAPRRMLTSYLLEQAQKHFDQRRQKIAELKTAEDVARRQAEMKAKFITALGGFPEKTPLAARVVGTIPRDGYRIEKIIFESRPNHHVTAVLFLPDGNGPFPAVLLPCGHSANGKASYQTACIFLAKNGIAALSYDPIGQGERRQLLDSTAKPIIASMTNEHTLVGVGALLIGENTATYRIWDGIRALDYLCSRSDIDAKRLGCTGCSGGGTLTSYLMALDERIVAAAPSCYVTSLERLFATIGPQDAEQNITGQVAFGMEHADYLHMRAPRPTLLLTASRDFFDIQGSWTTFREAKKVYGILGHGERVDLFEYDTGHGYPRPQREAMVRWMRRWLLNKDDAVVEEQYQLVNQNELLCTRTGQVLEDLKGKSVFDLNAERDRQLASVRAKQSAGPRAELVRTVRQKIALPAAIAAAKVRPVGEVKRQGYVIQKRVFETEPGISVPALLFTPAKSAARAPLVIYLNGYGKSADAAAGGPIEKLVQAGQRVLALDPRGIGETSAGVLDPDKPSYFGVDFRNAFLALHLDRPLLGQRVYDVLSVIEALAADPALKEAPLHLVGTDSAGPIAMHVAFLEPRIQQLTLERSLVSWSNVVHTPVSYNQLTNVVPGVLAAYDLPDLAAALAPRPVEVRQPLDAAGKPVKGR